MTTTAITDQILADIRHLEQRVSEQQGADSFPASFFSQTFSLSHRIITELHQLEALQIEQLRLQMEEHQRLIDSLPHTAPASQPSVPVQATEPVVTIPAEPAPEPVQPEQPVQPQPETPVSEPVAVTREMPSGISLNEVIERKNLSDFRKAFSLNDRFRFRRELFGGNEERMNQAIADLNGMHTFEESLSYLQNQLHWNPDEEAVADFIQLLEKRFL
ncbi:MAG: hypothetical protein ACI30I_01155 [Parabacteroides sp.]